MKIELDFIFAKIVLSNKPVVSGVKAQHAITKSDAPSKSSSDTARIIIHIKLRIYLWTTYNSSGFLLKGFSHGPLYLKILNLIKL